METRAEYVLVGGFVLAMFAGLAVALIWFAQVQLKASALRYDIYFEGSVTGLNNGSDVRYNGVPVGKVTDIELDPAHPMQVRVTVDIKPDVIIRVDDVAQLQVQGLTGVAYVQISGSNGTASPIAAGHDQRYPVIASKPSQLEQLFSAVPDLLRKLSALTDQVSDVMKPENRVALAETLDNMRRVSNTVAQHSKDIDAALAQLAPTMNHFQDTASHLDAAAQKFDQRGMPEFQQLLSDSRTLVDQLSRLTSGLERNPSKLLYGDRAQGFTPGQTQP